MSKCSVVGKDKADDVTKEGEHFKLVPPDGGYGWVIAFAHFLILGTSIPVQLVFGLLYRDVFIQQDFSPTEISVLLNVNVGVGYGFGCFLALFNGPLIRRFGYRKMAVIGSILLSAGMVLTSVAVTTVEFIVVYGVTASLGAGMVLQASQIAFNAYFKEKKSRAMGIAMTAVGACTILMPQLTVVLLKMYGPRGSCLIMAGVVMQGFVGASLLQPVKNHVKRKLLDPMKPLLQSQGKIYVNENTEGGDEGSNDSTITVQNGDIGARDEKIDIEEPFLKPNDDVSSQLKIMPSAGKTEERQELLNTLTDIPKLEGKNIEGNDVKTSRSSLKTSSKAENTEGAMTKKKGTRGRFFSKVSTVLDLSLMTNVVYANIIVGMSLAFASETNFSVMTPLILASMGFTADETATIMSTMAIVDILTRFLTPLALGKFNIKARTIYFVSIILLVSFRSTLGFLSTFESVLILGVGLGIAKGIRNVYIYLVIPSYVPNERLASAVGLNMAFSALLFLFFGPVLGLVVEKGGGYESCVHAINGITTIAILMWLAELVVFRKKRTNQEAGGTS